VIGSDRLPDNLSESSARCADVIRPSFPSPCRISSSWRATDILNYLQWQALSTVTVFSRASNEFQRCHFLVYRAHINEAVRLYSTLNILGRTNTYSLNYGFQTWMCHTFIYGWHQCPFLYVQLILLIVLDMLGNSYRLRTHCSTTSYAAWIVCWLTGVIR
jgi:hypothetical protein